MKKLVLILVVVLLCEEDQGRFLVGQAQFRSYLSRIDQVDKASLLGRARDQEEAARFHVLVGAARTVVVVCAVLASVAFLNKCSVSELRAHRFIDFVGRHEHNHEKHIPVGGPLAAVRRIGSAVLVSAAFPNKYGASEPPVHPSIDLCSRKRNDSREVEDFQGLVPAVDVE
ncbi:hypothetical protein HPB52_020002 [Rhipicephalus sanguineus]|uniref:Uncharacterized protein n=1 Tax=Rhipicephalus sanguineus TaxID=34632 RepID=A0A9D4STS3_RHISA|nr:hypothetical protein HPB52_020002 [Rhipicephalus sanguineus]